MCMVGNLQGTKMGTRVKQGPSQEEINGGRRSSVLFAKKLVILRVSVQRRIRKTKNKKSQRERWQWLKMAMTMLRFL